MTSLQPGSTPRNLTAAYDFDIGGGVGGDQAPPRGGGPSHPFWSSDGRFVYVDAAEEGRSNLKRIDAETGKVEIVTEGDHDIFAYSATPDAAKAALLISTPTNIGDLYILDVSAHLMSRLTHINERVVLQAQPHRARHDLVQELRRPTHPGLGAASARFSRGQEVSADPRISTAVRTLPTATRSITKSSGWRPRVTWCCIRIRAAAPAYGQEFGNIIQYHYPGDDYKDLMAGVDDLIARGWVDPGKARRHGRQRRRRADELGDRPDHAFQGRRFAALHRRLGATSGTPPISRCSRLTGSAAHPGSRRRISRRARPSPISIRSRRR